MFFCFSFFNISYEVIAYSSPSSCTYVCSGSSGEYVLLVLSSFVNFHEHFSMVFARVLFFRLNIGCSSFSLVFMSFDVTIVSFLL